MDFSEFDSSDEHGFLDDDLFDLDELDDLEGIFFHDDIHTSYSIEDEDIPF